MQKHIKNIVGLLICFSVFQFAQAQSTVKVSPSDVTAGYLVSKIVGGSGITVTRSSAGGNERLTISGGGGGGGWTFSTSTIFSLLTANSPITFSTSSTLGTFGCITASSGVAGCLSNTAFDTFNSRLSTTSANTLYYAITNPSSFISSAYASSTFPTFSYGSSTYYLASNPSSYITLGSLSATLPIRYTGGVFSSDLSTSTVNNWTAQNTFNNASATAFTATTLYGTNVYPNVSGGSFLASDLTGKIIATTSPQGTNYTATYPIQINGSVISSGFTTSTINSFTSKQTFDNASATSLTATTLYSTFATGTNFFSTNVSGTNIYPNITGGSLVATDLTGKLVATTTSSSGVTSVGLSMPTGYTISNSPVTTTGTLTASVSTGYVGAFTTATGTSGQNFNIATTTGSLTINCPDASASVRGCLASADWTIFNNKAPTASPTFSGTALFNNLVASGRGVFLNASTTNWSLGALMYDSVNNVGSNGNILSSTGTSTLWVATSSLFPSMSTYTGTYPIIVSGSVISSGFTTSTTNVFTGANTFNGNLTFGNATGSILSLTSATSTNIFATSLSSTNSFTTNATATNIGLTNATFAGVTGSFLATDLAGKIIATTSPQGTTYTGTLPIRVTGTVISTDFSTSTINTYSALNTFNSGIVSNNATTTNVLSFATATLSRVLQVNGTTIINSSRDLFNINTYTGGTVNGQTISNSASFTGSLLTNGALNSSTTLGVTGTTQFYAGATGTSFFGNQATFTSFNTTNATATNIGLTNASFSSILGSFLATDLTGRIIATSSAGGTTYTGTYPIIVTGSVISTGFSTTTNNVFFGTSSMATTTLRSALLDSANSLGTDGQVLSSTGTSTRWITNSAGGVSGSGSNGFLARWTSGTVLSTGVFRDNGTVAGVNATSSSVDFNILGTSANNNPILVSSSSGKTLFSIDKNGILNLATTTATTSPQHGLNLYAQDIAGQTFLALKGRGNADRMFQNALWNSDFVWFSQGITNTVTAVSTWYNTIGVQSGTVARVIPTVTSNPYTAMKRITFASVVTTANQQVGTRSEALFFRGSGSTSNSNIGGFFFSARVGFTTWTAGNRLFVGLSTCTTACLTSATTLTNLTNTVGFGVEAGGTGIVILSNDASGVISTSTIGVSQPALASNNVYDFYLYQAPNSPIMYWQVDNASTTAMIGAGILSTNLPATTTLMVAHAQMSNGTNVVVGNATLGVNRIYIETER